MAQPIPASARPVTAFAVATITRARNPAEETLLERALTRLADGRPVVVSDGGSTDTFVTSMTQLRGVALVAPERPGGLTGQVKGSLRAALALDTPLVFYTEPDKEQFFERGLDSFLRAAEAVDPPGVVLAARDAASLATFPAIQQYTEGVINTLCAGCTGVAGDYSYGPFLMDRRLVPYVLALDEDIGWGWRHFAFGLARRLGLGVTLLTGDYPCPADQRTNDEAERLHRMKQLQQNIRGLVLSQTVPL